MIGARLRALRKDAGLTMREFGKKFGLAESTISGYENGHREPDYDTLLQFANFFNCSVDYLLSGRQEERFIQLDSDIEDLPLTSEELTAIEKLKNDPNSQIAFKDFLKAPIRKQRSLLKVWEAIKNMDDN